MVNLELNGPTLDDIAYRTDGVEVSEPNEDEVNGEFPGADILAAHDMGEVGQPDEMLVMAQALKDTHPDILERAKTIGEDVVVFVTNGKVIAVVGVGLAAIMAVTGYVVYNHRKSRRERAQEELFAARVKG